MTNAIEQYSRGDRSGYKESDDRKARKAFYQSKEWKRIRAKLKKERRALAVLSIVKIFSNRDDLLLSEINEFLYAGKYPFCNECLEEGRIREANTLDHIIGILDGGDPLDPTNLEFLCSQHHNRKSALEKINRDRKQ